MKLIGSVQGRRKSVVILIVIIVIISIVGYSITSSMNKQGEQVIAVAQADRTIVRTDELVTFSSDGSEGDIHKVEWNFSEGNTTDELNPSHAFEFPGWYNVTLTVKGDSGGKSSSSITIGVQHQDNEASRVVDRSVHIRRSSRSGPCHSLFFSSCIGIPTVKVTFDISRASGVFGAIIDTRYWDSSGEMQRQDLVDEEFMTFGGNYIYERILEPNVLPHGLLGQNGAVDACIVIDEGKWESVEIRIEAIFPMDGLDPTDLPVS